MVRLGDISYIDIAYRRQRVDCKRCVCTERGALNHRGDCSRWSVQTWFLGKRIDSSTSAIQKWDRVKAHVHSLLYIPFYRQWSSSLDKTGYEEPSEHNFPKVLSMSSRILFARCSSYRSAEQPCLFAFRSRATPISPKKIQE